MGLRKIAHQKTLVYSTLKLTSISFLTITGGQTESQTQIQECAAVIFGMVTRKMTLRFLNGTQESCSHLNQRIRGKKMQRKVYHLILWKNQQWNKM